MDLCAKRACAEVPTKGALLSRPHPAWVLYFPALALHASQRAPTTVRANANAVKATQAPGAWRFHMLILSHKLCTTGCTACQSASVRVPLCT